MQIAKNIDQLRSITEKYKSAGDKIGFVPTMGALHRGHLSLIDIAKQHSDKVIASIFVNPKQFAAHEDLDKYPRDEKRDLELLEDINTDIVYLPNIDEIYPSDFSFKISVGDIGQELEGKTRPHFFDGVAIIVAKLFLQTSADIAVFGEKDYQQLVIIRKMVQEFNFPMQIINGPIIREENGLAMSSRNRYLSKDGREKAASLFKILTQLKSQITTDNIEKSIKSAKDELLNAGFDKVDYIEVRDSKTLQPAKNINDNARILAAAYIEDTRLLDNV